MGCTCTGNQLMRHVFRWRSRSSQIASGVKGLSMSTWTDCGYPRGSWAAIGLNPRRESPSGWGPFVKTVSLIPAVALTGCVGSSGRSKLGLVLAGVVPDVSPRLCLGNAMGLTTTRRGISRKFRIQPSTYSRNDSSQTYVSSRHSAPICLLCHGGAGS